MIDIMAIVGDWFAVTLMILALAGTTMETVVKPCIKEMVGKLDNTDDFKQSETYDYMMRFVMLGVAYLEAYAFRDELNIFKSFRINDIPEFVGVAMTAIAITFFSKQIHDAVKFFKAWGSIKVPKQSNDTIDTTNVF